MPIGILREVRNIRTTLSYVPKEGCTARSYNLVRSDTALGQSKAKPLLMCDLDFWAQDVFEQMVQTVANAVTRDWTTPQNAGNRRQGGQGITSQVWDGYRGNKYRNTVMIGIMLAKLQYGIAQGNTLPPIDFVLSAGPNILFKDGYKDHPVQGDNKGTQIHFEMSMAAQLGALIEALRGTPRFNVGQLTGDVDLFIEKGSMCDGCIGTWDTFKGKYAGFTYRSI